MLTRKAVLACTEQGVDHLLIGGGVAANSRLRALAQERCDAAGIALRVPRPGLCTDNGAMVAALGAEMVARGVAAVAAGPAGRLLAAGRPTCRPVAGACGLAAARRGRRAAGRRRGAVRRERGRGRAPARRDGASRSACCSRVLSPRSCSRRSSPPLRDRPGLAVGDALGANVTMLTACLGLAALVRPLPVGRRVRQYAVMSAVAGGLAVLAPARRPGRTRRGRAAAGGVRRAGGAGLVARAEPPALGELAELTTTMTTGRQRRPAVASAWRSSASR